MMHFFAYCKQCEKNGNGADFGEYLDEINDILDQSGFGPLYWRNPYDWLFLYSIYMPYPGLNELEVFHDIMYDMNIEDTKSDSADILKE